MNASRHVVTVTDKRGLTSSARWSPPLAEANFWTPSSVDVRALATGEPMLFKTHAHHNRLFGGGFVTVRVSGAWAILRIEKRFAPEVPVLEDANGYRKGHGKAGGRIR